MIICGTDGSAAIPLQVNHQGVVAVNGTPFTGTGSFRFALINNSSINQWTNDGSQLSTANMPTAAVSLSVANGLYSVRLGDSTLTNMVAISSSVFVTSTIKLRVWFDDGANGVQQLAPDFTLASAPYAYNAFSASSATTATNATNATTAVNATHASTADTATTATTALNALTASSVTNAINAITSVFGQFGGDGSDGARTVSGSETFGAVRRQYTNLTIPGGATLTVDQGWSSVGVSGTCTIAGDFSADGQGEAGGEAQTVGGTAGLFGTSANRIVVRNIVEGCASGAGGAGGGSDAASGGSGGGAQTTGAIGFFNDVGTSATSAIPSSLIALGASTALNSGDTKSDVFSRLLHFRGAGGGSGATGNAGGTSGAGGDGGGVIYIECNELIFTGTLGANGNAGLAPSSGDAGGGGGGGGGVILVRTRKITTNTGTILAFGGGGGSGAGVSGKNGGSGGTGFFDIVEVK